jgi:hypothetical protein
MVGYGYYMVGYGYCMVIVSYAKVIANFSMRFRPNPLYAPYMPYMVQKKEANN